jgi:hypothetical protein
MESESNMKPPIDEFLKIGMFSKVWGLTKKSELALIIIIKVHLKSTYQKQLQTFNGKKNQKYYKK